MADMQTKMIVTADGRGFERTIERGERKIKGFGKTIRGTMGRSGREMAAFGSNIGGLTTVLGGLSVVALGKGAIDMDARLARLAIQAGKSRKEAMQLKQQLFEIGKATRQDPGALLAGIEQIVEKTGNYDFAVASLKGMGTVASATGAAVSDIGAAASDLQEKMDITADKVLNIFDILANQGKAGSFTLQNMAALFPRLLAAAASFEVKGEEGMRKFGAFLQIARRGTGTSEQAATAVERTFADLVAKAREIRKMTGFSIFDPEASKKQGRAVAKDFEVVLKELITRTRGDVTKLNKIFGEESIRAIRPLAQSWQKFGDFREFDEFVQKGGDGNAIMEDFAFWTETTAGKLDQLNVVAKQFSDRNLAGPIDLLNQALDMLSNHPIIAQGGLYSILGLLGVSAVGTVAGGIGKFAGAMGRIFGKGGKAGSLAGAAGGLLGGAGPMPVYVVNKHLSMLPESFGFDKYAKGMERATEKSMGGLSSTIGRSIGRMGPAVAALLPAIIAGGVAKASEKAGKVIAEKQVRMYSTPALEKMLTDVRGGGPDTFQAKLYRKELARREMATRFGTDQLKTTLRHQNDLVASHGLQAISNYINMNLHVEDSGRTWSETDDMNTHIKLNRGTFVK